MKAGDRVLIEINGESHHCDVIASELKSVIILVNEEGEQVAKIQQFWRKTEPVLGENPKHVPTLKNGKVRRVCCAKGCGVVYEARKSDLDRGWGLCCSKSCAAAYRRQK
ncbi:hypothetical protein FDJ47_gp22 [Enterobacter phage Ec_L1]|uniref:Uncharacterized protein n=1 Tax=Enterobacter phage Ec_L1 TaxID=2070180 RepID=A0A2P0W9U8_9CAUD|nr:hypothetical protein FDJ47_gp22 [Enterobacter phage Ec_L1]AUV57136.1 hypothetical protein Ec22 [Enterobacter phage Ec_L1]